MIVWLWIGGVLCAVGTVLAAFPGRHRRQPDRPGVGTPITTGRSTNRSRPMSEQPTILTRRARPASPRPVAQASSRRSSCSPWRQCSAGCSGCSPPASPAPTDKSRRRREPAARQAGALGAQHHARRRAVRSRPPQGQLGRRSTSSTPRACPAWPSTRTLVAFVEQQATFADGAELYTIAAARSTTMSDVRVVLRRARRRLAGRPRRRRRHQRRLRCGAGARDVHHRPRRCRACCGGPARSTPITLSQLVQQQRDLYEASMSRAVVVEAVARLGAARAGGRRASSRSAAHATPVRARRRSVWRRSPSSSPARSATARRCTSRATRRRPSIRAEIKAQVSQHRRHRRRDHRLHRAAVRRQDAAAAEGDRLRVAGVGAARGRVGVRRRSGCSSRSGAGSTNVDTVPDDDDRALVEAALAPSRTTGARRRPEVERPMNPDRLAELEEERSFLLDSIRDIETRARGRRRRRRRLTARCATATWPARRRCCARSTTAAAALPPKPKRPLWRRIAIVGGTLVVAVALGIVRRPVGGPTAARPEPHRRPARRRGGHAAGRGPVAAGHRHRRARSPRTRGAGDRARQRGGPHYTAGCSCSTGSRRPTTARSSRASSVLARGGRLDETYGDPHCFLRWRAPLPSTPTPRRRRSRPRPASTATRRSATLVRPSRDVRGGLGLDSRAARSDSAAWAATDARPLDACVDMTVAGSQFEPQTTTTMRSPGSGRRRRCAARRARWRHRVRPPGAADPTAGVARRGCRRR